MLLRVLFFGFMLCCAVTVQATPEMPEEYLKIFQTGLPIEKEKAAETLAWAGISSPKLFDLIEQETIKSLPLTKDQMRSRDRMSLNYTAWLTKALAFSGNEKYRATIKKVIAEARNKNLKKHAMGALQNLDQYAKYNPVIAPKAWPEFQHPTLDQRLKNMLNSEHAELMRIAAKRIHYTHNYDASMLSALNSRIEATYTQPMDDDRIDAIAWMCRALAGSRSVEYRVTLERVVAGASRKKLKAYTKGYLAKYY